MNPNVRVSIAYSCRDCVLVTMDQNAAIEHAGTLGHVLYVTGYVDRESLAGNPTS
jgi:hypothetical protein